MIELNHLTFGYAKKPLIRQLDLTMASGQIHGLFGRNGAGKTSLLKLLSSLLFPTSGSIKVYEHDPSQRSVTFLQDSFFLGEEPYIPMISLKRYIQLYSPFYPKFNLTHFFQLLNEFDLPNDLHLKKISMGQRKKAMIAFALACNTQLLILDEPTNGLDIPSKRQFRKILAHIITDNRLFIISTHQVRDLHSIIDNILMLDEGRIIFNQTISNISEKVSFFISHTPPEDDTILYYDRVPGGYLCISSRVDPYSLEVDIESLFNAVLSEPKSMAQHFKTIYA